MANTNDLIQDLQEIATWAALIIEGKRKMDLTPAERELVKKLTARGFLLDTPAHSEFTGAARKTDHK